MAATKKKKANGTRRELPKKKCPICGKEKSIAKGFYKSASPLYAEEGCVPMCIDCVKDAVVNEDGTVNVKKLKDICRRLDKPMYFDALEAAYKQVRKEHSFVPEDEIAKMGRKIVALFYKNTASLRQYANRDYSASEKDGFVVQGNSTTKAEKELLVKKYSGAIEFTPPTSPTVLQVEEPTDTKWTKKDKQNRDYVIEAIGYDPFRDYPEEDRRFLFNQMLPYLEDDENVEDAYKLSQILQIVNNNKQIHVCDRKIANLDPIKDSNDIKTLNAIKKDLVTSNDKIAKENEISVKNRSNKDAGKSTLTYLMRELRERNFEKAEADYYDQLRGAGTQWAISISQKAILEHCLFDENDKKEIYETQLKLIDDLYKELDDKKEQVRQLLSKVDELNLTIEKLKDGNK